MLMLRVRKEEKLKRADAVLRVHYVDENGTPLDGSQYIVSLTKNGTVGEKATFAATSFTAPEGYELVGDVTDVEVAYGKDKDVNVKVKAIKEEKEARDDNCKLQCRSRRGTVYRSGRGKSCYIYN